MKMDLIASPKNWKRCVFSKLFLSVSLEDSPVDLSIYACIVNNEANPEQKSIIRY